MKRALLACLVAGSVFITLPSLAATASSITLKGAGATFPAPLYKRWIEAYRQVDADVTISFAAVGSGEGIRRFLDDSVDFGASDAAMNDREIAAAKHGALLVPVTAGMVALAYNLPGLEGQLKLDRHACVNLLMGKIRRWNDPELKALNPGLKLPDEEVQLVARNDSSGTTFALTSHLSAVSREWQEGPGTGKLVKWPSNTMIVQGNEGVAARVKVSPGSIGYMEYAYARVAHLAVASLENKAGHFVAPSEAAGATTLAANVDAIPENLRLFLPDPEGADAYPLVSFSWLLLKTRYADPLHAAALRRFVAWTLREGQDQRGDLGFIRVPREMAERGLNVLTQVQ